MSKQTQALKLALEALNRNDYLGWQTNIHVRQAIREALAEQPAQDEDQAHYKQVVDGVREAFDAKRKQQPAQQQEPVAWRYKIVDCFGETVWTLKTPKTDTRVLESEPLYTFPPASKPWVGLTDDELNAAMDYWSEDKRSAYGGAHAADEEYVSMIDTWRYIEAKLREKNT